MKKPVIVYVHGISRHDSGYSDAWHAVIEPYLDTPCDREEVRWSDLVNLAERIDQGLPEPREYGTEEIREQAREFMELEHLREEIAEELEARALRNGQLKANEPVVETNVSMPYDGSGLSWSFDDFVLYMLWEETRSAILERFDNIVVPLMTEGRALHILSHSWGTVVSYEALRRLDESSQFSRVNNFFTLGSALSLGPVQRNLLQRVGDGRRPACVDNFVNIDAGGDIVGGDLMPPFEISEQHLKLKPTGCSTFWLRPRTARNFVCAHSSYFASGNSAVQRDIIASHINRSNA